MRYSHSLMGQWRTKACFCGVGVVIIVSVLMSGCHKPPVISRRQPPPTGVKVPLAPAGTPSAEAQRQFQLAEADFQAGRLPEALRKFQSFSVRFPSEPLADDAFFHIGQIYLAFNDPYLASLALERIPHDFPTSDRLYDTYLLLARVYERLKRADDAITALRRLLEFSGTRPEMAQIYHEMAGIYGRQGRVIQALEFLGKSWSLAESPTLKNELRKEGESLIEGIQKEDVLHDIAQRFSNSFAGQFASIKLGEMARAKQRSEQAQKELQPVLANPLVPEYGDRARALLDKLSVSHPEGRRAIGCILPLSGENEAYGRKLLQGIELAARAYHNQQGASDIQLIYRDSRGEPESAREAVLSLAQESAVLGIIGPLVGKAAVASAEEAQRLQIPMVTLTPREDIPNLGGYVFRNFLTATHQIRFLVSYTMETLGLQRFAILYPDDPYGKKYMNLFWDEVESRKGRITAAESYSKDQTDFSAQIKKLVGTYYARSRESVADFQALLIPDSDYKVGLIAPQLAYFDVMGIYLLGTSLWNTPMLVQMAAPFLQKSLFVDGFFPHSSLPAVQAFVAEYTAYYGEQPDVWAAHAYDTAAIVLELLTRHQVSSRMELRDKLRQVRNYPGVTGTTTFTSTGEVDKVPFILTVRDNRIVEVGSAVLEESVDTIPE